MASVLALVALGVGAFAGLSVVAPIAEDSRSLDGLSSGERQRTKQLSDARGLYWAPGDPAGQLNLAPTRPGDYWPPAMSSAHGRRTWGGNLHHLGGYVSLQDPYRLPPAPGVPADVGTLQAGMACSAETKRRVDERVAYAMAQELYAKRQLSPDYTSSIIDKAPPPLQYLGAPVFQR